MEAIPNQVRRLALLALLAVLVLLSAGPEAHAASRGPSFPGPRALYTSMEGNRTGFWAAPATAPERASKVASVTHREGYGVRARPSPDGRSVAYNLWPPGNAETPAELWVLSLASRDAVGLMTGNDLHSPPLWSPDSTRVIARQGTGLLLVEVPSGRTSHLVEPDGVLGVYPFGWSPAGDGVYYATVGGGTWVHYLGLASGTERRLFQASEGIARDFALGPGDVIRYFEVTPGGLSARTVNLSGEPVATPQRLSAAPAPLPAHIAGHVEFAGWLP